MHAALELKNPQVKVHPDASVLPVTLDAYVETTKLAPYSVTKPQSGGQITINATDPHYLWDFGDGSATVITTSNGGPYPTGDVRHPYQHKNPYTIRLRTSWHVDATFTLDDLPEVGTIGPIDAPNNPQVTVASSTAAITIVEAHAVLVG